MLVKLTPVVIFINPVTQSANAPVQGFGGISFTNKTAHIFTTFLPQNTTKSYSQFLPLILYASGSQAGCCGTLGFRREVISNLY